MSKIYENITQTIGNTPLVMLSGYKKMHNLKCDIAAKLEFFNPSASVKDRAANSMIEHARKKGLLNKDTVIVEPTSGNTGIGLAMAAAAKGYKLILTMPDTMSKERILLIKAYGAQIVLTKGTEGMKGAIKKAEEIASELKSSFIPMQFKNPANPFAHIKTGREIWRDTGGNIDYFVAGIGTGGTITGAGSYLKQKNKDIVIVGVEPYDSSVLSGGNPSPHKIQGIGAGFIPEVLDTSVYDQIIKAETNESYNAAIDVAHTDGILAGISSGAALYAAKTVAQKQQGKLIVVVFADNGERYLSTDLYSDLLRR